MILGFLLVIRGAMGMFGWLVGLLYGELDGFAIFQGFFSLVLVIGGVLLIRRCRHRKSPEEV